ncbi:MULTISPECIES: hypothetical protein [unclassified Nitratiruptor]|uniref:hypothetical protein n=1 Tax=unclassified Nitratiruptor TaxID=2624044 RepID=UPI0019161AE6|nr:MULTISPECIES: hypothetical protein [unclassified Nitratiruptor]BCD60728.1 hypothetical protein NitYY0810_C1506 [Nitratiruptor sp. YY08-10]BCD64660.1 hypothetical protein NitYY0814_C1514 [Nitratiruptor sp. YY08-14]
MFKGLSLDQAPPFEAPLLFFLTAPVWFIVAAAMLLFDSNILDNLSILHLVTLGFMTQIMIGALQQMLPVVVGVRYEKPLLLSIAFFIPFVLGIVLFFTAFTFSKLFLLYFASFFIGTAVIFFILFTLYKLFTAPTVTATVWAMRLSLVSFLIAACIGIFMMWQLAMGKIEPYFNHLLLEHALFAGFGWVGLLIIGVSFQVIPMFYVTPELSNPIRMGLTFSIFALILSTAASITLTKLALIFFVTLLFAYILFGAITLKQLKSRKRKIIEPSIVAWYIALSSLFLLPLLFFVNTKIFSTLFLFGFAVTVMYGMLYKIIPFLAWFHISARGFFDMPTMKEMLDERLAYWQLGFHVFGIAALMFSPQIAGIFWIASNLLFAYILKKPVMIYFSYKKKPSPFENLNGGGIPKG